MFLPCWDPLSRVIEKNVFQGFFKFLALNNKVDEAMLKKVL